MEEYLAQLDAVLADESKGVWVTWLAKAEVLSGQPRRKIFLACVGLLSVYLVVGFFAELLCNGIGMAYPAYKSMIAIKTTQKDDDTQWLVYWTVFATFSLVDFASDAILRYFPLYWLIKCGFLFWLWCPLTLGAERMYKEYLDPAFTKYGPALKSLEDKLKAKTA